MSTDQRDRETARTLPPERVQPGQNQLFPDSSHSEEQPVGHRDAFIHAMVAIAL